MCLAPYSAALYTDVRGLLGYVYADGESVMNCYDRIILLRIRLGMSLKAAVLLLLAFTNRRFNLPILELHASR